ncbi:glycosyltransferase family 2 protein [Pseudorhodoferax sp.]|uniref:glycosyltransferase family 2 protein n=1 Tax=Pseudorhodoferax sp. TaxID=1993553 RepID=UPI002DD647D2|nr:glycosyltransferase family 2 protein [Pseudorhodoferax sp.]
MNTTVVTPAVMAVVVTFHPDPAALAALLAAVAPQVDGVIVVDNDSPTSPAIGRQARLIRLERNQGIAAAQNAGMAAALAVGARAILLLDQDSLPQADMVKTLQAATRAATEAGLRVGAAGPLIVDPDGHSEGFVRFRRGRYEALMPAADQAWIDCDLLIASGTLIPAEALHHIGNMAERLFIDKVDTEWSLRAAARGWQLIGVPAARLQHRLGLRLQRLWFFGWRRLAVHKPFRYYYMVRNGLLLRRLPHATAAWRRADLRQLLSLGLYFGLLAPSRLASARMMIRGLRDGLHARGGPLED